MKTSFIYHKRHPATQTISTKSTTALSSYWSGFPPLSALSSEMTMKKLNQRMRLISVVNINQLNALSTLTHIFEPSNRLRKHFESVFVQFQTGTHCPNVSCQVQLTVLQRGWNSQKDAFLRYLDWQLGKPPCVDENPFVHRKMPWWKLFP